MVVSPNVPGLPAAGHAWLTSLTDAWGFLVSTSRTNRDFEPHSRVTSIFFAIVEGSVGKRERPLSEVSRGAGLKTSSVNQPRFAVNVLVNSPLARSALNRGTATAEFERLAASQCQYGGFGLSKLVFCFRSACTPRARREYNVGSERAGVWCARSPQDFGQIVGQFRRRPQPPLEPARQVGDAVGSPEAQSAPSRGGRPSARDRPRADGGPHHRGRSSGGHCRAPSRYRWHRQTRTYTPPWNAQSLDARQTDRPTENKNKAWQREGMVKPHQGSAAITEKNSPRRAKSREERPSSCS